MNYLKIFSYGLLNKMTSLILSIGLFKGLASIGTFDGLKGEFYFIPAILIVLGMVLLFSKYLSEIKMKNIFILIPLLILGSTLIALS